MNGSRNGLTSIIIPTRNGMEWLPDCLYTVRAHTPEPFEFLVIDNASTDGTVDFLRQARIPFVSCTSNRGFPAACNLGLRLSHGDSLLLLNDDVQVAEGWLSGLLDCLWRRKETGIVGPMTNYASGLQQTSVPFTSLGELAAEFRRNHVNEEREVNRLVGFCFLLKRSVFHTIGELDERFTPGHYEDDDYCYRARQAGFRLAIAEDTFVYHRGSASFGRLERPRVDRLIEVNRQKFLDKWQVDPRDLMDPVPPVEGEG